MIFSILNYNSSDLLDTRNLQEQVKKALCFKNCSELSLIEQIVLVISKTFSLSIEKFLLTVGQNNFGNKIPFLQCVCKRKVVFLGGNIRSKSVLFGLKVCQKASSPVCLRKTEEPCCTMDEISKFCPINVRYLSLLN